ncbi:hypothetical protein VKN78_08315 [Fusobacterium polymorphum]|uniref:hypothetical protein n=1 Tax=Fusobacterium nucleatum subsp. polymorphum TaxID=76857 RepID=UPI002B4BD6DE|nr:hypothetical protein [Fusobacterium polymorphum]WRL69658.1 hypothetical protein VKN78_08315 [Fusobacterium polymorphum]
MKKFAMLALAMSLFLVACGEKKEEEKPAEQPAAEATAPVVCQIVLIKKFRLTINIIKRIFLRIKS